MDVEIVVARWKTQLDLSYIRSWLKIFSDLLETDDVINRFEHAWAKYGPDAQSIDAA